MADLRKAVAKFASDLAEKIDSFITDISELEIRTYTTPQDQMKVLLQQKADIADIQTQGNVMLRAYTRISFDGDTTVFVPETEGIVDREVWNLHQTMVNQALGNRATMIHSVGDAAASALTALKKAEM